MTTTPQSSDTLTVTQATLDGVAGHPGISGEYSGPIHIDFGLPGDVVHTTQQYTNGELTNWVIVEDTPWALTSTAAPHLWYTEVGGLRTPSGAGAIPPHDTATAGFTDGLPKFCDATISVHTIITGTPYGTLYTTTQYTDGEAVVTAHGAGEPETKANITAHMSWAGYLRWRGGADVLEMVARTGSVRGHWTELLCLHGLVQTPEWERALREAPEVPAELIEAFGGAAL